MNAPRHELINRITREASAVYGNLATVSASVLRRPLPLISDGRVIDYHVLSIGPRVIASCLELVVEPAELQDGSCEHWAIDDQNSDRPKQLRAIFDQHLPLGMFDQIIYRRNHKDCQAEFLPIHGARLLLKRDRHMQESEIDEIIEWVRSNASPQNEDWEQGLKDILASKFDSRVGEYQVIDAQEIKGWLERQDTLATRLTRLEQKLDAVLQQPRRHVDP